MLRGRVASFAQGMPLDLTPDPGVLPQALRYLVLGGRSPRCPLFLLVRSNQKPPTPSSTTYLRGEEVCLATRLGQIDVAEAN